MTNANYKDGLKNLNLAKTLIHNARENLKNDKEFREGVQINGLTANDELVTMLVSLSEIITHIEKIRK